MKRSLGRLYHSINKQIRDSIIYSKIFSEADQFGEGHGELLKEIWDRDVADMEQFFKDQKTNGTFSCNEVCTLCLFHVVLISCPV